MIRRDKILLGIVIALIIAVPIFVGWMISQVGDSTQACNDAGGVPLRGYCIDKDAIIEAKFYENVKY